MSNSKFTLSALQSRADRIFKSPTPKIPNLMKFRGAGEKVNSKQDTVGVAGKAPDKVYTGTAIVGIATMHKSNAVPVFSEQEAVDISKMRRG